MYTKLSYVKRKFRGLALKIFNLIDNNTNNDFDHNGEKYFIDKFFCSVKGKTDVVIFDVGANVGEYAEMLVDKASQYSVAIKLHLFEPTKSCYSIISKKFCKNDYIYLNDFGASDTASKTDIYYDKETSALASLYPRNLKAYGLKFNETESIQLRRLDSYIKENNLKHIDFIKIDIEGHELSALAGLGEFVKKGAVDYIQFEYGGANLDSRTSLMEIYQFFEQNNYKVAKIMPKGLEIRGYSPFMDNFSYANYVAISGKLV